MCKRLYSCDGLGTWTCSIIKKNSLNKGLKIYNFGTGKGSSVLDVIDKFEKVTKINIPNKFVGRRKGDTAISYCTVQESI